MKNESPFQILEQIKGKAKAFDTALSSDKPETARRHSQECATLFRRLAQMVPLREHEYLKKAKEWEAKGQDIAIPNRPGTGSGKLSEPDLINSEVLVPEGKDSGTTYRNESGTSQIPSHEVFISYSNPEKIVAYDLCSYLETNGIRCWIAPRDVTPGTSFPASIIDAIDASKALVLIFSKSSNNSPHVVRELTRAVTKNVVILPFRIEDTPLSKNMEYLINLPHWMDALPPPPQQHFSALADTLRAHLSRLQSANKV
jgi:hypothetical protein